MKPRTFSEVDALLQKLEMDSHTYVEFTSTYFPLLGEELEESDFDFLSITPATNEESN